MAHLMESVGQRGLQGEQGLTIAPGGEARQTTPRVYRFQPRKGRLDLHSLAQIDVGAIITKSDHGTLQGYLRNVVFGKVR